MVEAVEEPDALGPAYEPAADIVVDQGLEQGLEQLQICETTIDVGMVLAPVLVDVPVQLSFVAVADIMAAVIALPS